MFNSASKLSSAVTVKVVGGLGNQLFCYFAGQYLASISNSRLILDMSDIRSGKNTHDVTIESFDIDYDVLLGRVNITKNVLARILRKARRLGLIKDSSNYFSSVVGFDSNLEFLTPPVTIHGYFQSYKYFYHQKESQVSINLRSPSAWYREMEKKIAREPIIAIHVRRGDYENLKDSYGLLAKGYYQSCLEQIKSSGLDLPVFVFSDDINSARKILDFGFSNNVTWVNPRAGTDSAESLLLMSKATVNVIANSTFSWWAAALSETSNFVYAPRKWFKDLPDPEYLYPPDWIQVESQWES